MEPEVVEDTPEVRVAFPVPVLALLILLLLLLALYEERPLPGKFGVVEDLFKVRC